MMEFREFPKIARLQREIVITEKIDGTNASVCIGPGYPDEYCVISSRRIDGTDYNLRAGSRTCWITPEDDNFGFAAWVKLHADELFKLGEGHHFGEWWGRGIQRNYGLLERRFSLFNAGRWIEYEEQRTDPGQRVVPAPVNVVPVLYRGPFRTDLIDEVIDELRYNGSEAAPGFMKPEGIVVYHTAAGICFKRTIEKDEQPKSRVA